MPRTSLCLFLAALALQPRILAQSPQPTQATQTTQAQAQARPVADTPRARIDKLAREVDQLLATSLGKQGLAVHPADDDETFLRRASLAIMGRIPTTEEAERFFGDAANDKRERVVDSMLDSPGYTSHMSNLWFDLLRVKSRLRQQSGEPFAHWIRESVRTGMPYDEFVSAMVTASGPAHEAGNGATGYLLRDMNMPHDAMANTLRAFTGTRLECAQCHNHPFESWKQREFFAMAAFYGGLQYRVEIPADSQRALRQLANGDDERVKTAARRAIQTSTIGLRGDGTGVERLPQDYAYDDLAPRTPIPAASIFGPKAKAEPATVASQQQTPRRPLRAAQQAQRAADVDSRKIFAEWLTSPENDRFTRVIVNRMWKSAFGRALTEPLDDLKDDSKAVHPELERKLQRMLVDLDFDLRQFQRVLFSTRLFAAVAVQAEPSDAFLFQGPLAQRMSAEQLWDSLLTLQDERIDERMPATDARAAATYTRHQKLMSGDPEQIEAAVLRRPDTEELAQRRLQAIAERRAQDEARQARVRELTQKILAARRKGDSETVKALLNERLALALPQPAEAVAGREGMMRASDLEQPAANGHVLRQFGQSDRETMDGATRDASVPQALSLLNGPLGNVNGALTRRMMTLMSTDERIDAAFLAILTRKPSANDRAMWTAELAARGNDAASDLIWTLVNSHEFRRCP